MNKFTSFFFYISIFMLVCSGPWYSYAATYTSVNVGGIWSASTTWTCNTGSCTYPKANDVVIINGPVTLDAVAVMGGTVTSVTINTNGSLTLAANVNSNIFLAGGTLTTTGAVARTLTGSVSVSSGGNITPLTAAPLSLTGGLTISGGILTFSGGNLTTASLAITNNGIINIGSAALNTGKLTVKGNASLIKSGNEAGTLNINKGGTLDLSGYRLGVNGGLNGNPTCDQASANVRVDGVMLADELTIEGACMFISGVNTISSTTPPGFVKVQKNLNINQRGDLQIAGLYLVGGNVAADQGNIDITGNGYFGVAGTAQYQNNGGPVASLNYCQNSNILSCSPAVSCPFPAAENASNECANVCRAYVCSGFYNSFPLPVDLVSFSARYEPASRIIKLEWITSSETNNDYFVIERSKNGLDFTEIDKVKGMGTVAMLQTYTFSDKHPLSGIIYYRIRQVDLDGKYTFSKIVSVEYPEVHLSVFPNPTDGKTIYISWDLQLKNASVIIYNQLSNEVYRKKIVCDGTAGYVIQLQETLQKGLYYIKVYTAGEVFTSKLMVEN